MARREEERGREEQGRTPHEAGAQQAKGQQEQFEGAQQQMRGGQQQFRAAQEQFQYAGEKIQGAGVDMFTTWMKSQKAFTDSWLQAQSDLIENWISTTKNFQVSFLTLMTGEGDGGTKDEIGRLTDSWRQFMHDSYKVFNDGVVKMQEGWKSAFDKQMEITRDLAHKGSEMVKVPEQAMQQAQQKQQRQA